MFQNETKQRKIIVKHQVRNNNVNEVCFRMHLWLAQWVNQEKYLTKILDTVSARGKFVVYNEWKQRLERESQNKLGERKQREMRGDAKKPNEIFNVVEWLACNLATVTRETILLSFIYTSDKS